VFYGNCMYYCCIRTAVYRYIPPHGAACLFKYTAARVTGWLWRRARSPAARAPAGAIEGPTAGGPAGGAFQLSPVLWPKHEHEMAGGLGAHTNTFVEAWGLKREVVERTFRWTPKSVSLIALTGVLLPLAIYKIGVAEFVCSRKLCFASLLLHKYSRLFCRPSRTSAPGGRRKASYESSATRYNIVQMLPAWSCIGLLGNLE
jgi:hypothetical protein